MGVAIKFDNQYGSTQGVSITVESLQALNTQRTGDVF